MEKAPKRIFITGISGFIGFHLALALHKKGQKVVGCDHFNNYYDPQLKRARAQILTNQGISVLDFDVRQQELLLTVLQTQKTTHFVHLAAQAGVRYSLSNPQSYVDHNLDGFLKVLEACRSFPYMYFIYASSSSVYGLNSKVPFSESDKTDLPANFYGATKKANELMAQAYHHLFKIKATGLRFFTVYGPWGRPDMAYFSFAQNILEGKPIRLFNQGNMKRDFTYIDDIVEGLIKAIDLEASSEIFNLGGEEPRHLLELVSLLEKHLGKKALIEKVPMVQGDIEVTWADLTKSKSQLNFHPKVTLEQGVENFVDWFLSYVSASNSKKT